jgi:hypothetical protein
MIGLTGKEREKGIADLIELGIVHYKISRDQSTKRVSALVEAIDNGLFNGIGKNGPKGFLETMFVDVNVYQYMTTPID